MFLSLGALQPLLGALVRARAVAASRHISDNMVFDFYMLGLVFGILLQRPHLGFPFEFYLLSSFVGIWYLVSSSVLNSRWSVVETLLKWYRPDNGAVSGILHLVHGLWNRYFMASGGLLFGWGRSRLLLVSSFWRHGLHRAR
jgi:hypothetical protein